MRWKTPVNLHQLFQFLRQLVKHNYQWTSKYFFINQMTTTDQTNSLKMETTTPQSKVDTSTVKRCLTEANHNTTEANCNTTQANTSQPHYTTSEPQSTTSLISSTTNQKSSSIPETSSKTTLSVNQTTIISNTSSTIASQLPGSKSHLYSLSKYIQV